MTSIPRQWTLENARIERRLLEQKLPKDDKEQGDYQLHRFLAVAGEREGWTDDANEVILDLEELNRRIFWLDEKIAQLQKEEEQKEPYRRPHFAPGVIEDEAQPRISRRDA